MSDMLSELLQKPEQYVMVIWEEADILFAGKRDPCLYAELKRIGLPENQTSELSKALCTFLENRLNIQSDRIYIEFTNVERHLLGWNGQTFSR